MAPPTRQPVLTETLLDALTAAALIAVTVALCLTYSHGRIMWSDEIFGWMLVNDPSFSHMLFAWRSGADGGGIVFYLLARAWIAVFGHTTLAFRMFSAAGVAIAAIFTFFTIRRFTRWSIALFSVALLWFTSDNVLWQILQARFYGLLLAEVAAAGYLFVCASASPRPTRTLLLLTFLCHTALAGTHPFGLVYSAATVCAMLLFDLLHRRRPLLPLAAVAGWWILLPSLQAIRNTAAVGKPHFWTTTPTPADLGAAYSCWSLPAAIALGATSALFLLHLVRSRRRPDASHTHTSPTASLLRSSPILFSLALLLVPALVWIYSQGAASFFVDRYLLPIVIAMALLLAHLLTALIPLPSSAATSRLPRLVFGLAALALAIWAPLIAFVQYPGYAQYPPVGDNRGILPLLPRGLPLVIEPVNLFDQLVLYSQSPGLHYVSVLDWQQAIGPNSLRGESTAFHEMENWRKVGYFPGTILHLDELLAPRKPFAVLDVNGILWFENHFEHNPAYEARLLGTIPPGSKSPESPRLWLVCPKLPEAPPCALP